VNASLKVELVNRKVYVSRKKWSAAPGSASTTPRSLACPAHVWAGENAHDPVPRLPPSDPVTALSDPSAAHFGTNPASKAFGGQIFNADIDPSRSFSGIDFSARSSYGDPGSSSPLNMAHIVDAQYGSVSTGPQPPPNLESVASVIHDLGDLL
jgi:hypothetical protein